MNKSLLFILSITVALGITIYINKHNYAVALNQKAEWKTFIKKNGHEVAGHPTTSAELEEAKIEKKKLPERAPSSIKLDPFKGFMVRKNRILTGEIDQKYEDESTELTMINNLNPSWKEIMGNDLMRFHPEETKLLVKEELPVIQIIDGKGRYLEQVIITYLTKDGGRNSFKALVDSDSGAIVQTWDRTIQEKIRRRGTGMTLPAVNESGITTH